MYYTPKKETAVFDGTEMDYFYFGQGKKILVMIPGISLKKVSDTAGSVAGAYKNFCKDYTVYVFDRKNNIEYGYSIEAMAEDTAKAMKKIGISSAYVFGVSQGGMIAQILASKYPELVKKLLLASTSAKETLNSKEMINYWVNCAEKREKKALAESFVNAIYTDEFLDKYKDFLIEITAKSTNEELARFAFIASACLNLDLTETIKKIKCPTLVIGAAKDKLFSVDDFSLISKTLGCDMYIYEDYCHAVYDEAPDFKDKIAEFFDK